MVRRFLAVGIVAAVFAATSPVMGQPTQSPSASAESGLVGLAVYSSDGQKLGDVTHAGMAGEQLVVRADFGNFLGFGPISVIIPAAQFVQKPDRLEVKMTADEVKVHLAEQRRQQQQKE